MRFLIAVVGFSLGVLAASLISFSWSVPAFALLLGSAFLLLLKARPQAALFAIALITFSLGSGRALLAPTAISSAFLPLLDTKVELSGTVVADPDMRDSNQRLTVLVRKGSQTTKVLIVGPVYPYFAYGDNITVSGKLKAPEPFATDGGREFAYDTFLAKDGIFSTISYANVVKTGSEHDAWTTLMRALFDGKHAFIDALSRALPIPYSGLATGILTGGKQGLGEKLLDAFTIAGLLPVVVLSGYNVMIVANWIGRIFAFLPRRFALVLAGIAIIAFVLAAGSGSSAIRALLMASIALYARGTGRTYDALRALAAALLLMLLINPLSLVFDPGFQFSFAATLGLIIGTPLIAPKLAWIGNGFLREIVATSIAAQAFVLPLLLYQTGNLSVIAVIANVAVLPVIPLSMLLSFLAGVLSLVAPALAPFFGFPAFLSLAYVVGAASIAASLPFAQLILNAFPFWIVIALYAALAFLVAHAGTVPKQGT